MEWMTSPSSRSGTSAIPLTQVKNQERTYVTLLARPHCPRDDYPADEQDGVDLIPPTPPYRGR